MEDLIETPNEESYSNDNAISVKLSSSVQDYYDKNIANKSKKVDKLAKQAVAAEIQVEEEKIRGRKSIIKSRISKEVTQNKAEEDTEKHERVKTILKAQGLTEKLPSLFRVTAIVVGYPFFFIYLITLGWIIEFITFVVKGFITMIYDCADRFAELNKKFIENGNDKQFKLGHAITNILKWALILSAILVLIIVKF
jgi:hypothetical protein